MQAGDSEINQSKIVELGEQTNPPYGTVLLNSGQLAGSKRESDVCLLHLLGAISCPRNQHYTEY